MKSKSKTNKRTKVGASSTYKQWCDNHPDKRATYAFIQGSTGEQRGLCQDCFDEERELAVEQLHREQRRQRIKKARARRK